jgi:hypothetical protein
MASSPYKDPGPQDLVPIGGLERELRHRLGDQQLLYRSLRAAADLAARSLSCLLHKGDDTRRTRHLQSESKTFRQIMIGQHRCRIFTDSRLQVTV